MNVYLLIILRYVVNGVCVVPAFATGYTFMQGYPNKITGFLYFSTIVVGFVFAHLESQIPWLFVHVWFKIVMSIGFGTCTAVMWNLFGRRGIL